MVTKEKLTRIAKMVMTLPNAKYYSEDEIRMYLRGFICGNCGIVFQADLDNINNVIIDLMQHGFMIDRTQFDVVERTILDTTKNKGGK